MLKFFYRLTRRKGVVLFAVIAIMTLLIAMASTAYFTARSSYKTVVSNYNFSQMYLAATSVSDMMIAAATQDSQYTGTSAAEGKNFFKNLKDEIKNLKSATPGTSAAQFTAVSTNISTATSDADLYEKAAAVPVEEGIVDALKVVVALESIRWASDGYTTDRMAPDTSGKSKFYFSFTTTAYYKHNSITVQDIINNECEPDGGSPAPATDPPLPPPFASTGQELDGKSDRAVIIDTDYISDKTYFQSNTTVFLSGTRPNNFYGGVTASGSLYLCGQTQTTVPAPTASERHDWFIGGDLALLNDNTSFNLNGNNLYVNGDLIIATQNPIRAANIFVSGNVYVLKGKFPVYVNGDSTSSTEPTRSGGLFVGGSVKAGAADSMTLSGSVPSRNASWHTVGDMIRGIQSAVNLARTRSGGSFSYAGHTNTASGDGLTNGWELHGTLRQGSGGTVSGWSGTVPSANPGTYDPNTISVKVAKQTPNGTTYDHDLVDMTVGEVFDPSNEASPIHEITFNNYTPDQETYDNFLALDFTNACIDDSSAWTWNLAGTYATIDFETASGIDAHGERDNSGNFTFTFYSTNGQEITVEQAGNNGPVTTKIPWCKEGYRLLIKESVNPWYAAGAGFPFTGNGEKKILFETIPNTYKSDGTIDVNNTLKVVLMGNIDDGSAKQKDINGYNAFSWMGKSYNGSDCDDWILATGEDFSSNVQGALMFEMGNLDSGGNYIPYDSDESDYSITYFTSQREGVCTIDQKTKMQETASQPWENENAPKSLLIAGTSDADPDYENRIMLVSNQNYDTAINAYRKGGLFCGYYYAPNASLYSYGDGKIPIFGGLIVSDYAAIDAKFIYCEPDPQIMSELLKSMTSPGGGTPPSVTPMPTDGIWHTSGDTIMGRNYLG